MRAISLSHLDLHTTNCVFSTSLLSLMVYRTLKKMTIYSTGRIVYDVGPFEYETVIGC